MFLPSMPFHHKFIKVPVNPSIQGQCMKKSNDKQGLTCSQLLQLPALTAAQIQQLTMKQDHAVWRSVLKILASNCTVDHAQAITELKLALSQIDSFFRDTVTEANERIYAKVVVCTLSNLVNRLCALRRFKQAKEYFVQLCNNIGKISTLRQALYNLFGLASLTALDNYNLQTNSEFKYSKDTQLQFYYMVAKIKMASGRHPEARAALEKIMMMSKTAKVPDYLLIRVLDYLSEMDPQKYKVENENIMKCNSKQTVFFAEEKAISEHIIKTLLIKERELKEEDPKQSLSKRMLCGYLAKVPCQSQSHEEAISEIQISALLSSIQNEKNPIVVRELKEQSWIGEEVGKFYTSKLNNIFLICSIYHSRKLFTLLIPSKHLTGRETIGIGRSSEQLIKHSQLGGKKTQTIPRTTTPLDIERAKQILKKCILGAPVMKVNYGNNSIVERYLKIEEKVLAWAETKDEANYSSSTVKWKHVLGIVYGRVSSNLAKQKFSHLEPWRCFSLIAKDRSYDFYCQNEGDIFFWLQGISYQLQLCNKDSKFYPFYSKGRVLWKMTLLKMALRYSDSKKKYKCRNAGAVIEFRKSKHL